MNILTIIGLVMFAILGLVISIVFVIGSSPLVKEENRSNIDKYFIISVVWWMITSAIAWVILIWGSIR